ncbi:hypothetical protein C8J56DRAFT_892311 [Mycena floridula]|nr:hypothetical protein C8J56DRAFT_892311 [Mycena floridula]
MRLSLLSSIFFIASTVIAAPLVEQRSLADNIDLETRDLDDALLDLYLRDDASLLTTRSLVEAVLERRSAAKKAAKAATRKANRKKAKKEIGIAGLLDPAAKATKKADLKSKAQAKHELKKQKGKDYKDLEKGLPKRGSMSKGRRKTLGKDVRTNRYKSLVNKAGRIPPTNQKKIANKEARKDRKKAAKAQVKAAGPRKEDKTAKKTELRTEARSKHNLIKKAGKAYKGTQGLPARNAQYNVPGGPVRPALSFTGKDVRESLLAAHVNNQKNSVADPSHLQKFGKEFTNNPHENPGTSGSTRPLDGMTGNLKGKEHTFSKQTDDAGRQADHISGPVRIITKYHRTTGKHDHVGVVAHDQSRTSNDSGMDDHFEVIPTQ